MESILVIEDERELAVLLELRLGEAGYRVVNANTGQSGVEAIANYLPDLVILDLGLPDVPGMEVLDQIKGNYQWSSLPIMILSAHSRVEHRIEVLTRGADDYMSKPFCVHELSLRAQSLLRRRSVARTLVRSGALLVDRANLRCFLKGMPMDLTRTEYQILTCLLDAPGELISRSRIIERVWGRSVEGPSRSLDTHMRRLRNKLGTYSHTIRTVRNSGYRYSLPEA